MNWGQKLISHFQNKRNQLLKGIKAAERARDTAPSAMESASDTTRNENEKLVFALKKELKKINGVILKIPTDISKKDKELRVKYWRRVNISIGNDSMSVCLVPEGLGGEMIENVRLLSSSSPLGIVLSNKKTKDKFIFNKQEGVVIDFQ